MSNKLTDYLNSLPHPIDMGPLSCEGNDQHGFSHCTEMTNGLRLWLRYRYRSGLSISLDSDERIVPIGWLIIEFNPMRYLIDFGGMGDGTGDIDDVEDLPISREQLRRMSPGCEPILETAEKYGE